jgi:hypothetical protein
MASTGGSGVGLDDGLPLDSQSLDQQSTNSSTSTSSHVDEQTVATTNSEHTDTTETNPRPQRRANRSLVGKESRISEVHVSIGKKINAEYKNLNEIKSFISEGVTLSDLYSTCDILDSRLGQMRETYNELLSLCDNDENKIQQTIRTNYGILLSHADRLKSAIEEKVTQLEVEEQSAGELRNQEMEEEAQILERLKLL